MKNIFDFATKELSQDAFLRWFIETDFEGSGRELLSALTGVDSNKITDIKTWSQSEHIDICVDFTADSKPHILIIEDKVNTGEHSNQLERYMKSVKKWNNATDEYKNRASHFVFYKTRILSKEEKDYIESRKIEGESFKWCVFDLMKIRSFFEKYLKSTNLIIQQYAEYVHSLFADSMNLFIPKEHRIIAWKSFFEKTVKPCFDGTNLDVSVGETFYGYSYLNFRPKNCDKTKTPYLEIRSRDCLNNHMVGRILLYDVEISDEERSAMHERTMAFSKLFKAENNSQQIASTNKRKQEPISYKDEKEFIKNVTKMAQEYLEIVYKR